LVHRSECKGRCLGAAGRRSAEALGKAYWSRCKVSVPLASQCRRVCRALGRDHCLFFTVTDEDNLHPTLFARRWNSYLVRNGAWIVSFIRVLEPQKKGRPHYHLLVAVLWNTRADFFDWEAFDSCQKERIANGHTALFREPRARYKVSAPPSSLPYGLSCERSFPDTGWAELSSYRLKKERKRFPSTSGSTSKRV